MKFMTNKEFEQWKKDLEAARKEVESARYKLENTPKEPVTKEYSERLAEVEVKVAKLWNLLLETTPNGKDKLTRFGKTFGGMAKERL